MIDNNWQGIAYLMLEVAGLDFIEAIQVSYIFFSGIKDLRQVILHYVLNVLAFN